MDSLLHFNTFRITQIFKPNKISQVKSAIIDFLYKYKDKYPFDSDQADANNLTMFNKIMEFLITNDFTPSFVLNKKYQHSKAKKDLKFPEFETVNSGIYIRKFIYYKQKKIYFESAPFVYMFLPDFEVITRTCKDSVDYIEIGYFDKNNANSTGAGIRIYKDGRIYQGYFKDGLYHHYGRCLYEDGEYYEGRWKNGVRVY